MHLALNSVLLLLLLFLDVQQNWENFNDILATDVDVTNLEKYQQKQEMSNIKQIEVQNYIMFSVKLLRTLESAIT